MLSFVKVQEHLNKLREQQSRRTEITADMVLKELAAVASGSPAVAWLHIRSGGITICKEKLLRFEIAFY